MPRFAISAARRCSRRGRATCAAPAAPRAGVPDGHHRLVVIRGLHHVQLALPEGGGDEAEGFYAGLLGLERVPKPPELEIRGGAWFRAAGVEVHLGVEEDFRPARKAHPAFL